MGPNIRAITTKTDECREAAERVLTEWLRGVRKGEIIGLAIVGVSRTGETLHELSRIEHFAQIIAGMEVLKYRIISGQDD